MKSKFILQIFTVVLILMTTVTDALAAENTVVYGIGDPNIDVSAVQQAVDTGKVVWFSGTFDFGEEMFWKISSLKISHHASLQRPGLTWP